MYDTKVVIHNGVCTLAVPFLYTPFHILQRWHHILSEKTLSEVKGKKDAE